MKFTPAGSADMPAKYAAAKEVFQTVIDKYPRSDEAQLARDQLRPGGA